MLEQGHFIALRFVVSKNLEYQNALSSPALQCKTIVSLENAGSTSDRKCELGISNRFAWTGPDNFEEEAGVKNRGVTQISRT